MPTRARTRSWPGRTTRVVWCGEAGDRAFRAGRHGVGEPGGRRRRALLLAPDAVRGRRVRAVRPAPGRQPPDAAVRRLPRGARLLGDDADRAVRGLRPGAGAVAARLRPALGPGRAPAGDRGRARPG